MDIADIFMNKGILSTRLKNYEYRHQQVLMAEAISRAIKGNTHLIAEAATGVGKSIAYLIPLILSLYKNNENKKVVISTYTKALQHQLVDKDLPFLKNALGIDFNFALCLGGENYLCLKRLNQVSTHGLFEQDEAEILKGLLTWGKSTKTGLKSDMDFVPMSKLWQKVCREGDLCFGKRCRYYDQCFYQRAKAIERSASILVTNHHLFFAHIASGWNILPKFHSVVFDEAHQIEDVASDYLGMAVSNYRVKGLLDAIISQSTGKGLLSRLEWITPHTFSEIDSLVKKARRAGEEFFGILSERLSVQQSNDIKGSINRYVSQTARRIRGENFIPNPLQEPLLTLRERFESIMAMAENYEDEKEILALIDRCTSLSSDLESIICQRLADYVYWYEVEGRRCRIAATPIDISFILRNQIFEHIKPVILTSATLSIHGDFSFIKERLGIEGGEELALSSPFDYRENSMIYIPKGISDPRDIEEFDRDVISSINSILSITHGRTLILFTSYSMLNKSYNALTDNPPSSPFFKGGKEGDFIKGVQGGMLFLRQGEMDSYKLVEEFKNRGNAVLLGTHTFWQGVDIPGDALQCVIIVKLPFQVPDDPVTEARIERLKENGKDPFIHYQIPNAVILFKQGFGRLIRTQNDKGVVAILDPRVKTRFYGDKFLSSLPDCIKTDSLERIREFFSKIRYTIN